MSGFAEQAMSQRFAAEPLANLSKRRSLRIGQPQSRGQVRSEYAVFGSEVFVAQQQLLVNESVTLVRSRPFAGSANLRIDGLDVSRQVHSSAPTFEKAFRSGPELVTTGTQTGHREITASW